MPQAKLPDVNTAIIKYRNEAIASLKSQSYDSMYGSLYAINGLLDSKYRVMISTIEYNKLAAIDTFVICNSCTAESNFNQIKVFELLSPLIINVISGRKIEKVWVCTACHHDNKLSETEMIQKVPKEPRFLKVVPKPPERKDGLHDRSSYHRRVSKWAWTFLDELEAQASLWRSEYQPKDEFSDDSDIDTEGEGDE